MELHAKTVSSMQYIIKHKKGLASIPNGHMKPNPFHGVGQGAGDAGTWWGFISDMLIKAYNKKASDASIQSPITHIFSNHKIQAFVDDSQLFLIIPDSNGHTIHDLLKHDVQLWEQLLHVTGGKLEIPKCKFLVFTWTFNANGDAILSHVEYAYPMDIVDSDTDQPITIESITSNTPYKLLGVQIAFDGNSQEQLKVLEEKTMHLIEVFTKVPLTNNEAVLGYNTVAIPALYYPFPATAMLEAKLEKIQQKITNSLLPKIGLNRHFPRAVTYAPKYFGGLGFTTMAVEQPIAHITSIIGHYRAQSSLSRNYTQLLKSYMVRTGMHESPLINTSIINYVDAPWLEVTRSFLRANNIQIQLPAIPDIPFLRQNDKNIMALATAQSPSKSFLHTINKCRSFLQITFLSEMCNAQGTCILDYFRDPPSIPNQTPTTYSQSVISWPDSSNNHGPSALFSSISYYSR